MGAEFHDEGQTDRHTFAFRNFANAPKKLENKFNFWADLKEISR